MVRHQLQVADVLLQDPNIASAGVNVNALKAEIAIENAIVRANCW